MRRGPKMLLLVHRPHQFFCVSQYITVGASGGIFGFVGACIADIVMNWNLLFCDFVTENGKKHRHTVVFVVLIMDIALNSIIGMT